MISNPGSPSNHMNAGLSRRTSALLLSAVTVWQAYMVYFAFRGVSVLGTLLEGLGSDPPMITSLLLRGYRLLVILPLIYAVLAGVALLGKGVQGRPLAIAVVVGVLIGFLVQAWATEAFFRPVVDIISQIG